MAAAVVWRHKVCQSPRIQATPGVRCELRQDLITDGMCDQAYPYTEATFAGARRRAHSASTTGGHVGADSACYFSDGVGIDGTVRVGVVA